MNSRKIVLFFCLMIVVLLFLLGNQTLEQFFAIKSSEINEEYFYFALKKHALKNKFAKPEFFESKTGNFVCNYIPFFLNKFKAKNRRIELIYGNSFPVKIIGVKIKGQWEISGEIKKLNVYFYFCQPVEGSYVKKDTIMKIPLDFWLKRKTDAVEVVGEDIYEIYGQFTWIEKGRHYGKDVLTILETPLKQYTIISEITGKKLVLKINSDDFSSLKYDVFKYKLLSFLELVCAKEF